MMEMFVFRFMVVEFCMMLVEVLWILMCSWCMVLCGVEKLTNVVLRCYGVYRDWETHS